MTWHGRRKKRFRRSVLDDHTAVGEGDVIGNLASEVHFMSDEENMDWRHYILKRSLVREKVLGRS